MNWLVLFMTMLLVGGGRREPARWAVIVGVSNYEHFGDEIGGDLPGASLDAKALHDVLVGRWSLTESNVRLLQDEAATRHAIRSALTEWLPSVVRPGDVVLFYFSGHGSQAWDVDGDEEDGLDETIAPHDALPGSTQLDVLDDELNEWLARLPTEQVTAILDNCHAGTGTRAATPYARPRALNRDVSATSRPAVARSAAPARSSPARLLGEGILELAAAQAGQVAVEIAWPQEQGEPVWGGAFTTLLVRQLAAAAPGTTYAEIFLLTRNEMRRLAFAQDPRISAEGASTPVLGIVAPPLPPAPRDSAITGTVMPPPATVRIDVSDLSSAVRAALAPHIEDFATPLPDASAAEPGDVIVRAAAGGYDVIGIDGEVRHAVRGANPQTGLAEALRREADARQLALLDNPARPFALDISIPDGQSTFRIGELVELSVRSGRDGYLTVVDLGTDGTVTVLYPTMHDDGRIQAGVPLLIPTPAMKAARLIYEGTEPTGAGIARAFVTARPLDLPRDGNPTHGPAVLRALHAAVATPADDRALLPLAGWATAVLHYRVER